MDSFEQLRIFQNGNIAPCPWRKDCFNHPKGCYGNSYWCKRFDEDPEGTIKEHQKAKEDIYGSKNNNRST